MTQHLWSWEPAQFENLNTGKAVAEVTGASWDVLINTPNVAWGYTLSLPDAAKEHIMWRCRLEVLHILGDISPGVAFLRNTGGISFQINAATIMAELRRVASGKETMLVESFPLGTTAQPFDLLFEYNALTKKCSGMVNDTKVFDVQLPYKIISAPDSIDAIEIITTTSPQGAGTIGYGELTLQCE